MRLTSSARDFSGYWPWALILLAGALNRIIPGVTALFLWSVICTTTMALGCFWVANVQD